MKDTDVLPKEMMARSLSNQEVVLMYDDARKALDLLKKANFAFLSWEGWGKYPDGKVGHCDYQGTVSIDRHGGESWNEYTKRSYDLVKKTLKNDYKDWKKSPHAEKYELYFCITAISE